MGSWGGRMTKFVNICQPFPVQLLSPKPGRRLGVSTTEKNWRSRGIDPFGGKLGDHAIHTTADNIQKNIYSLLFQCGSYSTARKKTPNSIQTNGIPQ